MSYRNDHDAAVARVDALQHEVLRLAAENETLKVPATPKRSSRFRFRVATVLGGGAAALVAGVVLGLTASASGSPPPEQTLPVPVLVAANEPVARLPDVPRSLTDCANAIAPRPVLDPRKPLDVTALELTGAGCREALRTLAAHDLVGDDSVTRWARAEDRLANRISLLVVYYDSDPAMADGFAAAPQLWTEYDAALTTRNAAMNIWRLRQ